MLAVALVLLLGVGLWFALRTQPDVVVPATADPPAVPAAPPVAPTTPSTALTPGSSLTPTSLDREVQFYSPTYKTYLALTDLGGGTLVTGVSDTPATFILKEDRRLVTDDGLHLNPIDGANGTRIARADGTASVYATVVPTPGRPLRWNPKTKYLEVDFYPADAEHITPSGAEGTAYEKLMVRGDTGRIHFVKKGYTTNNPNYTWDLVVQ